HRLPRRHPPEGRRCRRRVAVRGEDRGPPDPGARHPPAGRRAVLTLPHQDELDQGGAQDQEQQGPEDDGGARPHAPALPLAAPAALVGGTPPIPPGGIGPSVTAEPAWRPSSSAAARRSSVIDTSP